MTTRIIMGGAAGRMGQTILRCAADDPDFEIVGGLENDSNPAVGKTVGELIGRSDIKAPVVAHPEELPNPGHAAVIHFSSPGATIRQLGWSVDNGHPPVIGTTGFSPEELDAVHKASHLVPLVLAPNMSVGVNTLFRLVEEALAILGEKYDIEITEMHHRFKKDAPSGTARRLGEICAEGLGGSYDELVVNGREGLGGERPARQIGMHALRGGDVVGEHDVRFTTLGEQVTLSHRAHSRETFARGALRAAAWLHGKQPGLYDMQDVLGLKKS